MNSLWKKLGLHTTIFEYFEYLILKYSLFGGCFVLFKFVSFWREHLEPGFFSPSALLSLTCALSFNFATTGPKPGMKMEEGEKNHNGKISKSIFLNWLEMVFRHIITFLSLAFIFSSTSRPLQPGIKENVDSNSYKQDSKTCKNIASRIQNLARILQELCIPLQDSFQDSCNF